MPLRMKRDYKNHRIEWIPGSNTITVKPQNPNGSKTIPFGLGNAVIIINTDSPPEKIIMPITGETTMKGLLPTSPYKWKKWRVSATAMEDVTVILTGYRGYSYPITYQEADNLVGEQVVASPMIQNGYSVQNIGSGRVEGMGRAYKIYTYITVSGLQISGEQVVKVGKHLFVLNDGAISAFVRSTSEQGFTSSDIASSILEQASAYLPDGVTIVEIAGGDSLKIRLSSGILLNAMVMNHSILVMFDDDDIGRITRNKNYKFKYKYYKSGGGTSKLMPLLEDDIVSVFEGESGDKLVKLSDITSEPIVGFCGGYTVTGTQGDFSVHVGEGNTISATGFGVIDLSIDKIGTITEERTLADFSTTPNPNIFFSRYPSSQKSYCEAHTSAVWKSTWVGHGKTGHVVGLGEYWYGRVEKPVVESPRKGLVPFIIAGGNILTIEGGEAKPINHTSLDGLSLIEFIYGNDMSQSFVMQDTSIQEVEATLAGYTFGYGGDHWEALPTEYL